jgi:hypothetical protein
MRGDGVKPSVAERATPEEAPRRQEASLERSMGSQGLHGVVGTRGVEAAPPCEQRAQGQPVQLHQPEKHHSERPSGRAGDATDNRHLRNIPAPSSTPSSSSIRPWALTSSIGRRATMTRSYPSRIRGANAHQASRRSRRARLRDTAPPTLRPATQAARERPIPGAMNTITRPEWRRMPVLVTRWMSRLLRSLGAEPRAALGPSPGKDLPSGASAHADPEPVGPLSSAYVGLESSFHRRDKVTKTGGAGVTAGQEEIALGHRIWVREAVSL